METRQLIRIEYPNTDLFQRVTRFLGAQHFPAFRNLDVLVDNGSVTLTGQVCSFYEKQVALDTCRRVAGVLAIVDQIDVEKTTYAKPPPLDGPIDLNTLATAKPR